MRRYQQETCNSQEILFMKSFELHIPTRIFFGKDKSHDFADALSGIGKHALVVIGGGSIERLGYYDSVINLLTTHHIKHTTFRGIEPNPRSKTINKAAAEGISAGVDFVLALGGGSVMDAAKGIAALIHEKEKNIWEFVRGEDRFKEIAGSLPIACIPTTAATASEVTPTAVISNPDVKGKSVIAYPFLKPVASWLNPAFHTKLPLRATRDGAADILSHVFENYLLGGNDAPFTDRYCENIMSEVIQLLPRVTSDPENETLRGRMLWASTLALNGLHAVGRNPTPFPMHSLEHALSGYNPELAHGRGLATIFPAYFRFLRDKDRCRDRLALLNQRVFSEPGTDPDAASLSFINRFEVWLRDNGLFQRLSDLGIPESAFGSIAQYALDVYGDGDKINAAGPLVKSDIEEIFKRTESQSEINSQNESLKL